MKLFTSAEFGEVRTAVIDGKPYVAGIDVSRALEYANPAKAVINHCEGVSKLGYPTRNQHGAEVMTEINFIPEGDVYRLIIKAAGQSRNPAIREKAKRLERWIFDEVLPAIRETGGYIPTAPGESDSEIISRALVIAAKTLEERERRIAALTTENEDLEAALNTSLEYWTVMKYNTETGRKWTMAECQSIGRRLSAYCRTNGYEIKSCLTGDDRFSSVHSYPLTAWEAFMERIPLPRV